MKGQGGQCQDGCKCGACQGKTCGMGGFSSCGAGKCHPMCCILRWVLGIIILLAVFGMGVMIGELKGSLEAMHGYGMMRSSYGGGYGRMYPVAQPMLQNEGGAAVPQAAPSVSK